MLMSSDVSVGGLGIGPGSSSLPKCRFLPQFSSCQLPQPTCWAVLLFEPYWGGSPWPCFLGDLVNETVKADVPKNLLVASSTVWVSVTDFCTVSFPANQLGALRKPLTAAFLAKAQITDITFVSGLHSVARRASPKRRKTASSTKSGILAVYLCRVPSNMAEGAGEVGRVLSAGRSADLGPSAMALNDT